MTTMVNNITIWQLRWTTYNYAEQHNNNDEQHNNYDEQHNINYDNYDEQHNINNMTIMMNNITIWQTI